MPLEVNKEQIHLMKLLWMLAHTEQTHTHTHTRANRIIQDEFAMNWDDECHVTSTDDTAMHGSQATHTHTHIQDIAYKPKWQNGISNENPPKITINSNHSHLRGVVSVVAHGIVGGHCCPCCRWSFAKTNGDVCLYASSLSPSLSLSVSARIVDRIAHIVYYMECNSVRLNSFVDKFQKRPEFRNRIYDCIHV